MNTHWIIKHNPRNIDDFLGNESSIEKINSILEEKNIPNMIVCGPPGVGKTSIIYHLVKQVIGDEIKQAIIEYNSVDIKGIESIRETINVFIRKKTNTPYKVIIIDEFDIISVNIQHFIRELIDIYNRNIRFILICNSPSKIIDPLQSRCVIVKLSRIEDRVIKKKLENILEEEKIDDYQDDALDMLVSIANGDMRVAINNLQAIHTGIGNITLKNVLKMVDQPHPLIIKRILTSCEKRDIKKAINEAITLYNSGYSTLDIVNTILNECRNCDIKEETKFLFIKEIGDAYYNMTNGIDSIIQLTGLISKMCEKIEK
jgi:replication factor C subunit 2/4